MAIVESMSQSTILKTSNELLVQLTMHSDSAINDYQELQQVDQMFDGVATKINEPSYEDMSRQEFEDDLSVWMDSSDSDIESSNCSYSANSRTENIEELIATEKIKSEELPSKLSADSLFQTEVDCNSANVAHKTSLSVERISSENAIIRNTSESDKNLDVNLGHENANDGDFLALISGNNYFSENESDIKTQPDDKKVTPSHLAESQENIDYEDKSFLIEGRVITEISKPPLAFKISTTSKDMSLLPRKDTINSTSITSKHASGKREETTCSTQNIGGFLKGAFSGGNSVLTDSLHFGFELSRESSSVRDDSIIDTDCNPGPAHSKLDQVICKKTELKEKSHREYQIDALSCIESSTFNTERPQNPVTEQMLGIHNHKIDGEEDVQNDKDFGSSIHPRNRMRTSIIFDSNNDFNDEQNGGSQRLHMENDEPFSSVLPGVGTHETNVDLDTDLKSSPHTKNDVTSEFLQKLATFSDVSLSQMELNSKVDGSRNRITVKGIGNCSIVDSQTSSERFSTETDDDDNSKENFSPSPNIVRRFSLFGSLVTNIFRFEEDKSDKPENSKEMFQQPKKTEEEEASLEDSLINASIEQSEVRLQKDNGDFEDDSSIHETRNMNFNGDVKSCINSTTISRDHERVTLQRRRSLFGKFRGNTESDSNIHQAPAVCDEVVTRDFSSSNDSSSQGHKIRARSRRGSVLGGFLGNRKENAKVLTPVPRPGSELSSLLLLHQQLERKRIFVFRKRGSTGRISASIYDDLILMEKRINPSISLECTSQPIITNDSTEENHVDMKSISRKLTSLDSNDLLQQGLLPDTRQRTLILNDIKQKKRVDVIDAGAEIESSNSNVGTEKTGIHSMNHSSISNSWIPGIKYGTEFSSVGDVSFSPKRKVSSHQDKEDDASKSEGSSELEEVEKSNDEILSNIQTKTRTISSVLSSLGVAPPFRDVAEIIPNFGELHMHITTNLKRHNANLSLHRGNIEYELQHRDEDSNASSEKSLQIKNSLRIEGVHCKDKRENKGIDCIGEPTFDKIGGIKNNCKELLNVGDVSKLSQVSFDIDGDLKKASEQINPVVDDMNILSRENYESDKNFDVDIALVSVFQEKRFDMAKDQTEEEDIRFSDVSFLGNCMYYRARTESLKPTSLCLCSAMKFKILLELFSTLQNKLNGKVGNDRLDFQEETFGSQQDQNNNSNKTVDKLPSGINLTKSELERHNSSIDKTLLAEMDTTISREQKKHFGRKLRGFIGNLLTPGQTYGGHLLSSEHQSAKFLEVLVEWDEESSKSDDLEEVLL